jgi:hypothetical protein
MHGWRREELGSAGGGWKRTALRKPRLAARSEQQLDFDGRGDQRNAIPDEPTEASVRVGPPLRQRRFQFHIGRVDIVISRSWYWLGVERCGGRWLVGFGFGRVIV